MTFRKTCRNGFTLLEALVAMVLISTTGMAVYGWINSSLQALIRVEEHALQDAMARNALAYMEVVNPMASPTGEAKIGPYVISWSAQLLEPDRDGAGYPYGVSLFRVGLYNVHVTVRTTGSESGQVEFDVRQVGYRQERMPGAEL